MIKTFSWIVVPGYAAFYFIISLFIDLPGVEYVLGVAAIVTVVINSYFMLRLPDYDGQIVITKDPDGGRVFSLELNRDPMEIEAMEAILFKVADDDFN